MTQDVRDVRRFSVRRVWFVGLVALAVGGLVWFGIDRSRGEDTSGGDGGRIEPVAATGASSGSAGPEQSANMPGTTEGGGDVASSVAEAGSPVVEAPSRPDLGLEEIVREFILQMYGGETIDSASYFSSTYAKLESTDADVKRRGQFELEVHVQLGAAFADDIYYQLLQQSLHDDWDACLNAHGLPAREELFLLSEEQQEAFFEERGIVGDRATELTDECWAQSRIYAGKDEGTDLLLRAQHQFYLEVAQAWVEANPDKVVALPANSTRRSEPRRRRPSTSTVVR
ncbi:MAG: hypothetical protein OXF11_10035 [Deltaproteobacteria bacterium]|nr:hypothetical protein [Deltaproteobacteria bacterium]